PLRPDSAGGISPHRLWAGLIWGCSKVIRRARQQSDETRRPSKKSPCIDYLAARKAKHIDCMSRGLTLYTRLRSLENEAFHLSVGVPGCLLADVDRVCCGESLG